MTQHPIMVSPSLSAAEVEHLMVENRIRHVLVVDDGKRLVGLVTRQRLALKPDVLGSLNVWEITRNLSNLTVKSVMLKVPHVVTVSADRSVERAAALMTEHKIGCLPVLEEHSVVSGIVTQVDILHSFQEMLGMPNEGVRVTVQMLNRPGEFARLMETLAKNHWGVMGIGTFPDHRRPNYYNTVIKITGVEIEEVSQVLATVAGQEIIDIRMSD
jgi:acetoin utilization protein AcuB